MKYLSKTACVLLLVCSPVFAAQPSYIISAKAGKLKRDAGDGKVNGFSVGYAFDRSLSVELDFMRGDLDCCDGGEDDYSSKAIYTTFKSEGSDYLFARLGYVKTEINDVETEAAAAGVGAGYLVTPSTAIELEYIKLEDSMKYIGLTAVFKF